MGLKWDMVLKDTTGVEIPQVPHTFGYHHAVFGYMNDQQVAIGESTIGNQRKMSNPTPSGIMDITMLTLLAMERGRTAREAIKLMGGLAEQFGYGFHDGGEMLAVSDPKEVWVFEIMPVGPLWTPKSGTPGAVWCARRVPDDHVSVCPNESRIGEIDLGKPDDFHGFAERRFLRRRGRALRPQGRQVLQLDEGLRPGRGKRRLERGPTAEAVAVLRPRGAVP